MTPEPTQPEMSGVPEEFDEYKAKLDTQAFQGDSARHAGEALTKNRQTLNTMEAESEQNADATKTVARGPDDYFSSMDQLRTDKQPGKTDAGVV